MKAVVVCFVLLVSHFAYACDHSDKLQAVGILVAALNLNPLNLLNTHAIPIEEKPTSIAKKELDHKLAASPSPTKRNSINTGRFSVSSYAHDEPVSDFTDEE